MSPATATALCAAITVAAYIFHRKIFAQVESELKADPLNIKLKQDIRNHALASQILAISAVFLAFATLIMWNPNQAIETLNTPKIVDEGQFRR
jgi:hypothetical protein